MGSAKKKVVAKVVIVGGGFGGLSAAKHLGNARDLEITLLDRRNHHLFQPLLYQVATAGLSPADIAVPIRSDLSKFQNTTVLLAEVTGIDLSKRQVFAEEDAFAYDFLVLACGANHSYFGHDEWAQLAPGLKTLEQATDIRRRILIAYEEAERETDPEKQKALLTFVVVGGGPTGMEMAGAIAEISCNTLARDFRRIDPSRARVILVEAGSRLVASFAPELSEKAARSLESLGVQIRTSTRVTQITPEGVYLEKEFIAARTVVWAAGVQPSPIGKLLGTELDRVGRVVVTPELSIAGHPEVFVIGDQACFRVADGTALPGLAPVAIQQGQHVAKSIRRGRSGQSAENRPFHYKDKGQMATIGRSRAVLQVKGLKMEGWFAWMAWLFIHIYYLIGFRNKVAVFLNWTWSYITFTRGARLIVGKN